MTDKKTPKSTNKNSIDWEVICEEYLALKESKKDLTIKGFCAMRSDLAYNTARVKMPKLLPVIIERSREDQRKIMPDGTKARRNNNRSHKEYFPKESDETTGHGIYSKYFDPDLLDVAAQGTLHDDLTLYRAKALQALNYITGLHDKMQEAIENGDLETAGQLEERVKTSDKALSWCLARIESIAMTIKRIELTSVLIVKERANIVKTKAQIKAVVAQTKKFSAEGTLARARVNDLGKTGGAGTAADIIKEIQTMRDKLPSFVKHREED